MAIKVGDAVLKITGDTKDLDRALQNSQNKVQSAMQKMQKSLRITGIAFTALGAAGLKMVDSARKMNAQLGVTALNLGVTTKEMRDLALETTNVTFPLKEVLSSFDLLARAGIKDTEVLKATAMAFDTLGDALGRGASQVTEAMVPAMKTFRLSAEEIASKTDIMTYMVRNSTASLDDFNTMVGYTDQEMVAAGFTIDDMAAAMMYMSDNGVEPGRVMLREWMKAVTRSKEEGIAMTEALGMTSAELETYRDKLDGATGMTQKYAEEANKQYGFMDRVKQKFEELTLVAGSFLTPLEPILAAMTALGPIMILLSTSVGAAAVVWIAHAAAMVAHKIVLIASTIAIKAATIAQWLWNAALTANPIGIVIMAIAGLIAAGIALWKNWDKVVNFFKKAWSSIKIFFLTGIEKILGALAKFTGWIPWLGKKIQEAHDHIAGMIDAEKVKRDAVKAEEAAEKMAEEIEKRAGELTETIKEELEEQRDARLDAIAEERSAAQKQHDDAVSGLRKTYGILEREDEEYQETKLDIAREATDAQRKQYDIDISAAREVYREKIELYDAEYAAKLKLLDDETVAIISEFQRQIDAIDAQTKTEEKKAREAERTQRLLELKGAVESAETEEERLEAIAKLEDYQARVDRERLLEGRRAEKEALKAKIDETREAAASEHDRLTEELDQKKTQEQALLDETVTRLGLEKEALDIALEEELLRIDDERMAFEEAEARKLASILERLDEEEETTKIHYEHQLSETELHIAAINAATAELKDREVTVTIVHRDIYVGSTPTTPPITPPLPLLPGFQQGGIAMRPMTVRIAEKVPEAVIPLDRIEELVGGYKTANIFFQMDGRMLVRLIGQPLVDEIRIRQGVNL